MIELEKRIEQTSAELKIEPKYLTQVLEMLKTLREYHRPTEEHAIRVGLKAKEIAEFMHIDPKPAFYASLHDMGKTKMPLRILTKTEGFSEQDMAIMRNHAMEGYKILMAKGFIFSAWLTLLHHRYQDSSYPLELPEFPKIWSDRTKVLVYLYSRITALADFNDALNRRNDKYSVSGLPAEKTREIMLTHNLDQKVLIENLYKEGIFN